MTDLNDLATTYTRETGDGITLKQTTAGIGRNGDQDREHWSVGRMIDGAWHGQRFNTEGKARAAFGERRATAKRTATSQAMHAPDVLRATIKAEEERLRSIDKYGKRGKRGGLIGEDRKDFSNVQIGLKCASHALEEAEEARACLVVRLDNAVGVQGTERILALPEYGRATAEALYPTTTPESTAVVFPTEITHEGQRLYPTGKVGTNLATGVAVAEYAPADARFWFDCSGYHRGDRGVRRSVEDAEAEAEQADDARDWAKGEAAIAELDGNPEADR